MLKNLKVGIRIGGSLSLIIALMLIVVGVSYTNFSHFEEANGWNTHTYSVLDSTGRALRSLINIETGQRGFLISGRDEFLEPLVDGQREFKGDWEEAKKLTSDNPRQQERLNKLKDIFDSWMADAVNSSIQLRRTFTDNGSHQAELLAAAGKGKTGMDAMRRQLSDIEEEERGLLKDRTIKMVEMSSSTRNTMIVGGVVALIFAIVAGIWTSRSVTIPIAEAVTVANAIAAGDLSTRITVNSKDEIGQLLAAMGSMQAGLIGIVSEIKGIVGGANRGDFSVKMNLENKGGYSKELSELLNQLSGTIDTAFKDVVRVTKETLIYSPRNW